MIVRKFGGTSIGTPERLRQVAEIVVGDHEPSVVVLSAFAGTTNALVTIGELAKAGLLDACRGKIDALRNSYRNYIEELFEDAEVGEKILKRTLKHFQILEELVHTPFNIVRDKEILALGEVMSTRIFHAYLQYKGVDAAWLNGLDFMLTCNGEPDLEAIETDFKQCLAEHANRQVYITQGFICKNEIGEVDNLKRGGSDYTASILGAVTDADEIQIWTDIDGIHNNDPRVVGRTRPVHALNYSEAAELAYFGAKVLHPATVHPARMRSIPVRLLNTMDPTAQGTIISAASDDGRMVKAIAAKDGIAAVNIKSHRMLMAYGFLRKVFEVFERHQTPIDMITTSEVAISLTIDDPTYINDIRADLEPYGEIQVDVDQTIICIVGQFRKSDAGIAVEILQCLKDIPIRMISSGGSESNISVLVDGAFKQAAMEALNTGLFFGH